MKQATSIPQGGSENPVPHPPRVLCDQAIVLVFNWAKKDFLKLIFVLL